MTKIKYTALTLVLILCALASVEAQTSTIAVPDGGQRAVSTAAQQMPVKLTGSNADAIVTVTNTGAPTGGGVGISGNAPVGSGVQGSGLVGVEGRGGTSGTGVSGLVSGNGTGVVGQSGNGGTGVRGNATGPDSLGVRGSGNRAGVLGEGIGSGSGVYGQSTNVGVFGISTADGTGVFGTGLIGVRGKTSDPTGYAGVFEGRTRVEGLLTVGGGCTGCSPPSDRSLKANFSTVNPRSILTRLASMPIQSWNYKSEAATVRHIGPMAQDFRAAFGLGESDKTLNTVDASGVTMAALQGLYQMMQEKDKKIEEQNSKIRQLEQRMLQLERSAARRGRGKARRL